MSEWNPCFPHNKAEAKYWAVVNLALEPKASPLGSDSLQLPYVCQHGPHCHLNLKHNSRRVEESLAGKDSVLSMMKLTLLLHAAHTVCTATLSSLQ